MSAPAILFDVAGLPPGAANESGNWRRSGRLAVRANEIEHVATAGPAIALLTLASGAEVFVAESVGSVLDLIAEAEANK